MPKKLPWMQFCPTDYIKDTRILSLEARAIWMDVLCLMHESGRRGYLYSTTGKPISISELARFAGASIETTSLAIRELTDSGVAELSDTGDLFSRRMVREERTRQARSKAGAAGAAVTNSRGPPGLPRQNGRQNVGTPLTSYEEREENSSSSPKGDVFGGSGGDLPRQKFGKNGDKCPSVEPVEDFGLTPEGLAQHWCFVYRGPAGAQSNPYTVAVEFREWIEKLSVTPEALQAEIGKRCRDRTEPTWDMKKRLLPKRPGTNGHEEPSRRYRG